MKKLVALFLSLTMILTMAGCKITIDGETSAKPSVTNGTIGLSVSTQNNPFFVTLVEGAEAKAKELGVSLSVADAGDDVTKQVADIEDLVAKNISVLIVNPVDSDAVAGAVESAIAKGVRVISVDRAVNGVEIDCQIASDNVLGAELATSTSSTPWARVSRSPSCRAPAVLPPPLTAALASTTSLTPSWTLSPARWPTSTVPRA